ncbi:hypothetical protein [Algihabitans albus]|uniref:hypothetical protein n=1 Tax=Algihabitans albus TaxID=2164067 RepID=UPI000E5CEDA5|nr:hypothetical protein [Algihabitans albus]
MTRGGLALLLAAVAAILTVTAGGAIWMWRRLDTLEAARAGPPADMTAAWWAFALGGIVILGVIALFVRLTLRGRTRQS